MDIPKYSQTAIELLRRIRRGVYKEKLPPMRELAAEFGIAIQTMFNAVQLLVRKGLLVPHGSGGMIIDRSQLPCGLVAIAVYDSMPSPWTSLRLITEMISSDGYTPIFLGVPRKQQAFVANRMFKADIAGVIFLYSAINPEYSEVLNKKDIPFVSANVMPGVKNVNFVEKNTFGCMEQLVKLLYEKGYRKIAINLVSPLEGYLRYSSCQWRKILKKYDLPYSKYNAFLDEFPVVGSDELFENVAAEPLKNKTDLPEAVIHWNGSGIKTVKRYDDTDCLLLLCKNTIKDEYVPENTVLFSTVSSSAQQYQELWDLLLCMLIGGVGKTVHHFLDMEYNLHNEIPNINEYKQQEKK